MIPEVAERETSSYAFTAVAERLVQETKALYIWLRRASTAIMLIRMLFLFSRTYSRYSSSRACDTLNLLRVGMFLSAKAGGNTATKGSGNCVMNTIVRMLDAVLGRDLEAATCFFRFLFLEPTSFQAPSGSLIIWVVLFREASWFLSLRVRYLNIGREV